MYWKSVDIVLRSTTQGLQNQIHAHSGSTRKDAVAVYRQSSKNAVDPDKLTQKDAFAVDYASHTAHPIRHLTKPANLAVFLPEMFSKRHLLQTNSADQCHFAAEHSHPSEAKDLADTRRAAKQCGFKHVYDMGTGNGHIIMLEIFIG